MSGKDLYFVAVKVFLRRGGKFLILKDSFGIWDIPGGRLKPDEFNTPLEKVVARKMREELGSHLRYALKKPVVFMRHERRETAPGNPKVRIFAVGYEAIWKSGEIALSPRHPRMEWVSVQSFKPERYFKGGWLRGIKEYLLLRSKS